MRNGSCHVIETMINPVNQNEIEEYLAKDKCIDSSNLASLANFYQMLMVDEAY